MSRELLELKRRFIPVSASSGELNTDSWLLQAVITSSTESWGELVKRPYVVVLGEAGAGKSTEFRQQADRLSQSGEFALCLSIVDLAGRGLHKCLHYQRLQELEQWCSSSELGYIFLDSLDDARLQRQSFEQALNELSRGLGQAGCYAHVYVSCRISDWRFNHDLRTFAAFARVTQRVLSEPSTTEPPPIHVVGLAPLGPEEVRQLVEYHGIDDVGGFEHAIREAHAHQFILRPLDVEWLCLHWLSHGRLGSLTELIEGNVEDKLRERPERNSTLEQARARSGLTQLAGIASLCGSRSFLLPQGDASVSDAAMAINPRTVLDDWSDDEIRQLLTRRIFDEATHGRVRIHHRTLQDYLCARWLQGLIENGTQSQFIHDLLFHTVANTHMVPAHLESIAAWLAGWDETVRHRLCEVEPGMVLELGDPSRLPEHDRVSVLRAYAATFSDRERRFHFFSHESLARFASSGLVKSINELLAENGQKDELSCVLLDLVAFGRLAECIPVALRIALDVTTSDRTRRASIHAVAKAGAVADRQRLLVLLDLLQEWEQEVAAAMIRACFPDLMDNTELCRLLERVQGVRQNYFTSLQTVIDSELPQTLDLPQLVDLLQSLLDSVRHDTSRSASQGASNAPPESTLVRPGRGWLLRPMSSLVCAIMDSNSSEPLQVVTDTLELFRESDPHEHRSMYWESKVHDALSSHGEVRRALFWSHAARTKLKSGRFPTRYRELRYYDALSRLTEDDILWLAEDALSRGDELERLLAFDTLSHLEVSAEQRAPLRERVEQIAAQDEDLLGKRWARAKNPPLNMEEMAIRRRWTRNSHVRKERRAKRTENNHADLLNHAADIRAGTHFDALWHLCSVAEHSGNDYSQISLEKVQDRYGTGITEAFREGMKRAWRMYDPPLPHETQQGTPYPTIIGLSGLTLDVSDGLDVTRLESDLAHRAVRYAASELNQFPAWLSEIAKAMPAMLRDTLKPTLSAEYHRRDASAQNIKLLYKLPRAPRIVSSAFTPALIELLDTGDPPATESLECVLESLLLAEDDQTASIELVAKSRCSASLGSVDRFSLWWSSWLIQDAVAAVDFLEVGLTSMADTVAYQQVEAICARLYSWTQYSQINVQLHEPAAVLTRLIPLVFHYINPEQDTSWNGARALGPRDNAESLRHMLVRMLTSMGTEDATHALQTIADDPRMEKWRDRFLYEVEKNAAINISIGPMTLNEAMQWAQGTDASHAIVEPVVSPATPSAGPVTHMHFHGSVSHLAVQSGAGTQTVTTNITHARPEPANTAQAWNQQPATNAIRPPEEPGSMESQAQLITLLSETFSDNNTLRAFLRQQVNNAFVDGLPSPETPKSHYIDRAAERLIGHRALTPKLVEAWANVVPGRATDIRSLLAPDATTTLAPVGQPDTTLTDEHLHTASPGVDVVLLTAIALERKVLLQELGKRGIDCQLVSHSQRYHNQFTLKRPDRSPLRCLVAQPTDKGSRGTQALVEHLVRDIDPSAILLVGVAGALRPDKVALYDVVLARQVWDYEPAQFTPQGYHGRPKTYPTSPRLIDLANALNTAGTFTNTLDTNALHIKEYASGEKTIMDPDSELRAVITSWSVDIYACEMEAPGMMHALWEASRGHSIECGVIKCISDLGDPVMQEDKEAKQTRAASRAVRLTLDCLALW